jgi:HSP20 family molecular chaperone IbpA
LITVIAGWGNGSKRTQAINLNACANKQRRTLVTLSQNEMNTEGRSNFAGEKYSSTAGSSSWRAAQPNVNAGDALVALARDTVHAHMNVWSELARIFFPGSLGDILRHDTSTYSRTSRGTTTRYDTSSTVKSILSRIAPAFATSGPDSVRETVSAFILEFKVPGWTKEQLNVYAGPNWVTVRGEKREEEEANVLQPSREPRVVTYFGKWIASEDIDPEAVSAAVENGVLRVTVAKQAAYRARNVPVS